MKCLGLLAVLLLAIARGATAVEPDYAKALNLAWLFYEGQQSGRLPCWNRNGWWAGGWRVSAHLEDGKDINKDLSGGFYDAGDHLKVTLPLGFALSTLAWAVQEFNQTYKAMDQLTIARNNIKWGTDWLIKAHVQASDKPGDNVIVAQVGDPGTDHEFWWKPQDEPTGFCRSVMTVDKKHAGADVAASAAAALASAAAVFQDTPDYSSTLLTHAKQLFGFAVKYPGTWKVRRGSTIYNSTSYKDDIAWAAAWLCRADASFCKTAVAKWHDAYPKQRFLMNSDWNNVFIHTTTLLLSMNVGESADKQKFREVMENKMVQWTVVAPWQDTDYCTSDSQPFRGCYSQKGLMYMTDWGNMPRVATAGLNALIYSNYVITPALRRKYRCWARQQLKLMLGGLGRSFLVGYGAIYPTHVHHRAASCPTDPCTPCTRNPYAAEDFLRGNPANDNVHAGALLGGPARTDVYDDNIANYQQNEPALDSNSGFAGAMAGMVSLSARLPSGLSWDEYCDANRDISDEPLLPTPSYSTIDIPPATSALTAKYCAASEFGPDGACNKSVSTIASGVSLQCTPDLQPGYTGAAGAVGMSRVLVGGLVALVTLAVMGVRW